MVNNLTKNNLLWEDLLKVLHLTNFEVHSESQMHPHVQEEQAELYHSFSKENSELEILNFLHAIVLLYKPKLILETGAANGSGTLAMASALAKNGRGKIITIEMNEQKAKECEQLINHANLTKYVQVICSSSLDYIDLLSKNINFDMVFFDSNIDVRLEEFQKLYGAGHLKNLVLFHDTSRFRTKHELYQKYAEDGYVEGLDEIAKKYCKGQIEMPFSRGLRIMQIKNQG